MLKGLILQAFFLEIDKNTILVKFIKYKMKNVFLFLPKNIFNVFLARGLE